MRIPTQPPAAAAAAAVMSSDKVGDVQHEFHRKPLSDAVTSSVDLK